MLTQTFITFSESLLKFHNHYCKDLHDSEWCKFHSKKVADTPLLYKSKASEESMADKPQEYYYHWKVDNQDF